MKHHKKAHSSKLKRDIDKFAIFFAILTPLMTTSQVFQIYSTKSVSGVSILTWITFLISTCFWLTYSILHKDKVFIMNGILWLIVELLVVIGILIYGV